MSKSIQDLHEEGKEFVRLKRVYDTARFPEAGTPAYIISSSWLKKFKEYTFYDAVKYNGSPDPSDDHVSSKNPGKIINADLLHTDPKFLKGTGQLQDFESDVVDTYLDKDKRERIDYEFVNEEIWQFLKSRYGCDQTIKRYYAQGSWSAQIDAKFVLVPVFIAPSCDLFDGKINQETFSLSFVQLSKKKSFSDFKKRLADVVTALLRANKEDQEAIQVKNIRMWSTDDKPKLLQSFDEISTAQQPMDYTVNGEEKEEQEGEVQENSGVEFPGESLEPFVGTSLTIDDCDTHGKVVVIEVGQPNFAYRYTKAERVFIGNCEFCNARNVLRVQCLCKRVRYCKERCREKDEHFHMPNCSAQADAELSQVKLNKRSADSKNGVVGLSNLGNTCFMNSSLQCLSNTYELTKFFLEDRFSFINKLEQKNPLGTEGRLVLAYAKLLNEMWNMGSGRVSPSMFKRILGEYAPQFAGYEQHDSHECINTVLDLLGEDLYRKGKKPYVEIEEKSDQPEAEAAKEAWHKHLQRNESVVTDLFHGQFKSTLCCSQCDRVSITFDPWMTISLPIPQKKEVKDFFFIPLNIKKDYSCYSYKLKVGGSDNLRTLREVMYNTYGKDPGSFVIATVFNNEFNRLHTASANVLEVSEERGATIMYEIDPSLRPSLPNIAVRQDNMYNLSKDVTMLQMQFGNWSKQKFSNLDEKEKSLPRLLWTDMNINLKQLHKFVFKSLRFIFSEWVDISHPDSTRPEKNKSEWRHLADFPYRLKEDEPMTKEKFDALSDDEAFELCFAGYIRGDCEQRAQATPNYELEQQPYQLEFKNTSGSHGSCKLCTKFGCKGCLVPYVDSETLADQIQKYNLTRNDTLFEYTSYYRGKEVVCQVTWHPKILKEQSAFLSMALPGQKLKGVSEREEQNARQSSEIQLDECLQDFKQSETLDEENKWYCNKCKDFVQATKTLEIYRVPRIMIISLKRFKSSRSRWGFGGQKVNTLVEFPLEGLDMRPYVLMPEQKNSPNLIYDCYAISNHMGGVGGGHYTAYGKNPVDGQWYDFDDSYVQPVSNSRRGGQLITESAYNLFYRLRTNDSMDSVDVGSLQQRPNMEYLGQLQAAKKTKK